jgi:hypothetical protein
MSTFTIDPDKNITALVEVPADADQSTTFSTEKEIAKLVGAWPILRMIDAWNSFAGVAPFQELKPIKKFADRRSAVAGWQKLTVRVRRNWLGSAPGAVEKTRIKWQKSTDFVHATPATC